MLTVFLEITHDIDGMQSSIFFYRLKEQLNEKDRLIQQLWQFANSE